ncbi:MAG: hypothetical protein KC544_10450 [Gemmatimonadetes bacterium]|nr:hypothetical protein [Gemmatimonadota bacterium]
MTRRWTTSTPLLAALALGCASNPPPPMIGGGTPERAPSGEVDRADEVRITLANSFRATATLTRRDSIILTLPDGRSQLQRMARSATISVQLAGDGQLRVRLDSLAFMPPLGEATRDAIGTTWQGALETDGIHGLRPDRRNGITEELTAAIQELLPAFPRAGARTGTAWQDTTESTRRVEIFDAKDQRRTTWKMDSATTLEGIEVHPLTVRERYEQLGEGKQAGRTMRMSAQGVRSATYYITRTGMVDRIVQVDSASRLITIPDTRQAIPTTQVVRTTVEWRYR